MVDRIVTVNDDFDLPAAVTARLNEGLTATYAPAALAGRAKTADGIFDTVLAALADGRTAAIQVVGDSTGNGTNEWVYLTADWLGDQVPTCHIAYKVWNDTTQAYGPWSVVQAGAGERHAYFPPTWARSFFLAPAEIPAITGDIDVRVRVALDNFTSGGTQTLIARYGGAGLHAFKLEFNTSNFLLFTWSVDGTTDISLNTTTVPVLAAGSTQWLRATLDVDNGAAGNTCTLYSSVDGVTWTTLRTLTQAGVTSIFNPVAQEYEIGARAFIAGSIEGRIYEAQIRDGIDGKIVNPQPIDSWVPRIASGSYLAGTFGGGPTLYVINGSHPGATQDYLADATRLPRLVHPYQGSLIFQSCSHNDANATGAVYLAARKAWLTAMDTRAPGSQHVLVTQNPQTPPNEAHSINNHARRRLLLMAWAARNGLAMVDTYGAFLDDPRGLAALIVGTDGVHPNTDGSLLWAAAVQRAFLAA